ncbi:MAG: hypothetical protein AAF533_05540 [Acidobacteriota bacterium]
MTTRTLALVLFSLFVGSHASATTLVPMTPKQVVSEAARIFVGTCVDTQPITVTGGMLATEYTFRVESVQKGEDLRASLEAGRRLYRFRQYGGLQDGRRSGIVGLPQYEVGQRYRLALRGESQLGLTSPVGFGQGVQSLGAGTLAPAKP